MLFPQPDHWDSKLTAADLFGPIWAALKNQGSENPLVHYRSVDDSDTILTIEAFDDAVAGEAHVGSEHFQQGVGGDSKQCVAERPEILYIDLPDRDGWDEMAEF